MVETKSLLQATGLTKFYGAHRALHNVSFELRAGEVLCVVGENGAGKSTLIKILSGAIAPDHGTITLKERDFSRLHPRESMELGLATIYQDVELIDSLTVADNIFLGDEHTSGLRLFIDTRSQNERAREILDLLHIGIPERALVEELSAAQKQTLQIVRALHRDSKILIMDEPTSSLGHEETRSLMDLVRRLKGEGIGIIYISHYLEEVFEIGDTILVLKDGEHVGSYPRAEVDPDSIVRKMVGRDASVFFSRKKTQIGEPYLEVQNLSWNGLVQDVSFRVRRGEVFGIGGLVGSGRSELVSLIYGISPPDHGRVLLGGVEASLRSPADAIRRGICLITEDRHKLGMFMERSVTENITIVHNERRHNQVVGLRSESRLAAEMIRRLRIAVDSGESLMTSLSGGNQQKTIVARWLIDDSLVYIFDEPTKGVDVGAKQEIYRFIVEVAEKGGCVIMISSDMPELISMSDRIGVMRNGRMTHIIENENVTEEQLIRYFIGV